MEYTNIKLDRENAVATVRLNRPDALNALNPDLLDELSDAVSAVAEDHAMKAMVVRGEGRAFCAGADLTFFDSAFENPDQFSRYVQRLNSCLFQLEELPIPVVAVVHRFALAGGWS